MDCLSRRHSGKRERVPCDSRQNGRIVVAEGRRADEKTIACCALLLWAMQAPLCAQASPEAEETKAGTDQGEEELSLQELKGGLQEAFGGMVGVMGAIMGGLSSGLREGAKDA